MLARIFPTMCENFRGLAKQNAIIANVLRIIIKFTTTTKKYTNI